jgi:hypothetical protein
VALNTIKQTTLKTNGFIQTATAKEKKIVCHGCLLLVKLALNTDCIGSCKSNYHMIMATTAPPMADN